MPGRGYLLAVSQPQADAFLACGTVPALERWVTALLAGAERPRLAEVDKAWPAIRRSLAGDGTDPALAGAVPPVPEGAARAAQLVPAPAVPRVARALDTLDEASLRDRFFASLSGDPDDETAELDFLYTWQWFERLRALYRVAASEQRAVLFTVGDWRAGDAAAGEGPPRPGPDGPARRLA